MFDPMKHPSTEEWMDFLYEEIDPTKKSTLAAHLRGCSTCQDSVKGWQQGMRSLDTWQLPANRSWHSSAWAPWLKWAAVAMVCASAGFAGARISTRHEAGMLRASIEQPLRMRIAQDLKEQIAGQIQTELKTALASARTEISQELLQAQQASLISLAKAQAETQQLLTELARTSAENRTEDQKALLAALSDLQTLRKELETVAVLTEDSFRKAENQIVRLASLNE
jgi:hypothetical protein